jgi:hypothetical protein
MADRVFLWLVVTSSLVILVSWVLYAYVTSVAGYDQGVFEMVAASSALLVSFVAVSLVLSRHMRSQRDRALGRT